MIVAAVKTSHQLAALDFKPRRYVVNPPITPYPPGLAHDSWPVAAVARESCIIHTSSDADRDDADPISYGRRIALTPDRSSKEQWQRDYRAYHDRQTSRRLCAALCRFEFVNDREALATCFEAAPVLSSHDRNDLQLNVNGRIIPKEIAIALARHIAESGSQ